MLGSTKPRHENQLIIPTVLTQSLSEKRETDKSSPNRPMTFDLTQLPNIAVEHTKMTPSFFNNSVPKRLNPGMEPYFLHRNSSSSGSQQMNTNPLNISTMTFGPGTQNL
jgi:hypothetical protein